MKNGDIVSSPVIKKPSSDDLNLPAKPQDVGLPTPLLDDPE